MRLQERGLREGDWNDPIDSRECNQKFATAAVSSATATSTAAATTAPAAPTPELDSELKKKKLNAPRRITKIEASLAKHEDEISKLDDEMYQHGRDRGKLADLQKKKDEVQAKIDKLYAEYRRAPIHDTVHAYKSFCSEQPVSTTRCVCALRVCCASCAADEGKGTLLR